MRRPRRTFSAEFRAKVASAASTAKLLIFLDRDAKTQPKTPLFRPQVSNFGAQGEQRALPRFAGLVAKRLHQLHVSARARAGEFHEHVRSLAQLRGNANTSHVTTCHYRNLSASTAKLLIFLDRDAKTQPKTPLFRPQVSNFGKHGLLCKANRAYVLGIPKTWRSFRSA